MCEVILSCFPSTRLKPHLRLQEADYAPGSKRFCILVFKLFLCVCVISIWKLIGEEGLRELVRNAVSQFLLLNYWVFVLTRSHKWLTYVLKLQTYWTSSLTYCTGPWALRAQMLKSRLFPFVFYLEVMGNIWSPSFIYKFLWN